MGVVGSLEILLNMVGQKSLDLSTAKDQAQLNHAIRLTGGTGANKADILWHDRRTVAAASTDDLDLAGVLADAFGDTVDAAVLKMLILVNRGEDATIEVARDADGPEILAATADALSIGPGAIVLFADPSATAWGITAGTGDTLTVTNMDAENAATYDVYVVAASA